LPLGTAKTSAVDAASYHTPFSHSLDPKATLTSGSNGGGHDLCFSESGPFHWE
jgi:hypothetical protein